MTTFSIRVDGSEVARVTGDGIECAKKQRDKWSEEFQDDPKLLRLVREGKTILVFYVSAMENVTVEKVSE